MKLFFTLVLLGTFFVLFIQATTFDHGDASHLLPGDYVRYFDTPEYQTSVSTFETRIVKEGIEVTWEADEQDKVEYFQLSRSLDGKEFKEIYIVKGEGNTKSKHIYQYLDEEVLKIARDATRVHYQLNQIDETEIVLPLENTTQSLQSFEAPGSINELLPQITPKSPSVAAIERHDNFPVNLYTGLAAIEIPIWEISVGDMTIPIKLKYHPGGHKVLDHASWVGMGWSLTGIYPLTVDIRGKSDQDAGLLEETLPNIPSPMINCLTEELKQTLNQHIYYDKDLERDVFTYRTPLKTNSFILKENGDPLFLESDKTKIDYTGGLNDFTVTDDQGNRFLYDELESTFSNHISKTTAWYLSEIEANQPGQKVRYTYQDTVHIDFMSAITDYETWITNRCVSIGNPPAHGVTYGVSVNSARVHSRNPKEIFFPGGKVVFVQQDSLRKDGLGYALERIEIYGYNFQGTGSYTKIRQYDLDYIYKNRLGNSGKVLFLNKVHQEDKAGVVIGTYDLEYNSTPLPKVDSRSKDHWGYYNGKSNSTLIPPQTFQASLACNGPNVPHNVGGANRNASPTHMQAWMLQRMTFPTGGYKEYSYEPHQYMDGGSPITVGGLRIKSIVAHNGTSADKTVTRRYKYGTNGNGNGTRRDIGQKTLITNQEIERIPTLLDLDQSTYKYQRRHFSSGVNLMVNPFESVPVTYPTVTVYEDLSGSGTNGWTRYTFKDNSEDDLISSGATSRRAFQSEHWKRGQLLSKVVYDKDGHKKVEETHTYKEIVTRSASEDLGYIVGRTRVRLGSHVFQQNGICYDNDDEYNPVLKYEWFTGLVRRCTTNIKEYDDVNNTNYVESETVYSYDPTYYQLKEVKHFGSDGSTKIKKYRYWTDIAGLSPSSTEAAAALYQQQQNNELHQPIEVLNYYQPDGGSSVITSGIAKLYKKLTFNGYNYLVPHQTHVLAVNPDALFNSVSFSPASLSGNSLQLDSKYELRMVYDTYDGRGNLTKYHLPAGSHTSMTYTNRTKDAVYHTRLNTEKRNDSGSNYISHTTSYTSLIPLLGVDQITAPNGLKSYFEYDDYGRLWRTKDDDEKILEEYIYHIQPGSTHVEKRVPRTPLENIGTLSPSNIEIYHSYYDGLGRPTQTVHVGGHPNESLDIVTNAVDYDNLGRIDRSFVPFSSSGNGNEATLPTSVHSDAKPYDTTVIYDNSPLNRPKKQLGPGKRWHDYDKSLETKYQVASSGSVRLYPLISSAGVTTDNYGANTVSRVSTISEEGNTRITYRDNEGKVVQVSQQLDGSEYGHTHYIYDQLNRPRYIIQPKQFAASSNAFDENDPEFNNGIFTYKYDKRGRVRHTHVPGSGWTDFVYDRLDRLVLSQNDFQETQDLWTYSKYDALGRVIETGEVTSAKSRFDLQLDFDTISQAYEQWHIIDKEYTDVSFPGSVSNRTPRVKNYYDVYDIGSASVPNIDYDDNETNQGKHNDATGLLTWSFVDDSNSSKEYHKVHYYDNRGRLIQTIQGHQLGGSTPSNHPLMTSFSYNFIGEVTSSSQIFELDGQTDQKLVEDFTYDHKGRPITYGAGINSSTSQICTSSYDPVGRLLQKVYYPGQNFTYGGDVDFIYRPPNPDGPNVEDEARKGIILDAGTEITLNEAPYSADIVTGTDPTNINGLQTMDYEYNIRDQVIGINTSSGNHNLVTGQGDLFSLKLQYTGPSGTGRYDGKLWKQSWQVAADQSVPLSTRVYTYGYDNATRITGATYTGGTGENFSVSGIDYDKNGNLMSLVRKKTASSNMDNLSYTYNNGNRLIKVEDTETEDHEVDFVNRSSLTNEYEYYPDGCLKKDLNENISIIDYDLYLGKPSKITLTTGEWIEYRYNGAGDLIQRTLSSGTTWDYLGGMILKDGKPYQITTAEGRVVYEEGTPGFEFGYRDQVGNLRVGFRERDGSLQKTQVSDYTPFGIPINQRILTPAKQSYTYHGHEEQPDFGLRMTSMGARCYNQTIGRFLANDPLSMAAPGWTGYRLGYDNPVNVTDPTGNMEATDGYGSVSTTASVGFWDLGRKSTSLGDLEEREVAREIQYDDSGKATGVKIGYQQDEQVGDPGGPINPGDPLYLLIDSRQDELGNWHYYKKGTNEEIHPPGSGVEWFLDNVEAFMPSKLIGGFTTWLNSLKARKQSVATTKSLLEQAEDLVGLNGGRNSVTLRTPNKQIRYDLAGRAHGGVPTPHMQVYKKNYYQGRVRSITRATKEAIPMTQSDIRLIRKFLERLK